MKNASIFQGKPMKKASIFQGFTIIELLVSMGILLLIGSGSLAAFKGFNENQRVRQSASTLKSDLRNAQNKAIAGDKPTSGCGSLLGYTVSFSSTGYAFQALCNGGLAGTTTSVSLPTSVRFNPVPASVTFAVLTGRASQSVTLTLVGATSTYTVEVSANGSIRTVEF